MKKNNKIYYIKKLINIILKFLLKNNKLLSEHKIIILYLRIIFIKFHFDV